MSEKEESSSPTHSEANLSFELNTQNNIQTERSEEDYSKQNGENELNSIISKMESSELQNKIDNTEDSNATNLQTESKLIEEYSLTTNAEMIDILQKFDKLDDQSIRDKLKDISEHAERIDLLQKFEELDDQSIREKLKDLSEHELLEISKELKSINFYLSKENEIYEFILNDDEILQSILGRIEEVDENLPVPESFELTYPVKCNFAQKKIDYMEKALKQRNDDHALELQNLLFELESLNKSLKDVNESKEKFDKNIRIDGRHPVTNKIILQKVEKYFHDSIRTKMALANRYKIQIQGDIIEQNKILSQIKDQEKTLAFLDKTEFQEAQFEYKKSCRELAMYKEKLGKFKAKFSFLLQKITKLKRELEKEENDKEEMKNSVIKLEHLKEVMLCEKTRNDQKVLELKAAMRKIKLDPRRHNLPEVIDYATAKRENVILKKKVEKWRKKVEGIQQEKLLHLNSLSKKNKY